MESKINIDFSKRIEGSQMKKFKNVKTGKFWKDDKEYKGYNFNSSYIIQSDALELLNSLNEEIADIVFLDPPFNLSKNYGDNADDDMDDEEYNKYIKDVLQQSVRLLKPGGALYLYHIPVKAIEFSHFLTEYLNFRHWVAISMKNGFVRPKHLYPAHYALLYFTKGKPQVFNRPKIDPLTCPHCENFVKDYGGYKKYIEDGINLSDVWDDLSPVRHKKYKHRSQNELPIEIPKRAINISGKANGLLVDPFAGTGTSLVTAQNHKMNFIGSDIELENCKIMFDRLSNN